MHLHDLLGDAPGKGTTSQIADERAKGWLGATVKDLARAAPHNARQRRKMTSAALFASPFQPRWWSRLETSRRAIANLDPASACRGRTGDASMLDGASIAHVLRQTISEPKP